MNIKTLKLTVIALGTMVSAASFAAGNSSAGIYVRPEVGLSNFQLSNKLGKALDSDKVDIKRLKHAFKSSVPTAGIVVGARPGGNFGVELGYSALRANSDKFLAGSALANDATNTDGGVNVDQVKEYVKINNAINNISLDANYNLAVGNGFQVLPSVGVGYMHSKVSFKKATNDIDEKTLHDLKHFAKKNANDIQPRAGLSAMYSLTKNFNLTSGVSYQMANNFYNGVTTVKAGFDLTV